MEVTKWFDTNYHFIVPEFWAGQEFSLASHKVIDEFTEALELGIKTRPVLLGPVSFVLLGKVREGDLEPLDLLDGVLGVYEDVLRRLAEAGAEWVQIDEPCLGLDLDDRARAAYGRAYDRLRKSAEKVGGQPGHGGEAAGGRSARGPRPRAAAARAVAGEAPTGCCPLGGRRGRPQHLGQ
jgi:5-methyltetrahydropteroyltriglutamate--homocysteine methyltransferase